MSDDALHPLQHRRLVILADLDKREEMEARADKPISIIVWVVREIGELPHRQ